MQKDKIVFIPVSMDELGVFLRTIIKTELASNQTSSNQDTEYIDTDEAMKVFGVSRSTILNWRKKGLIKSHKFGSRVRFLRSELLEVMHRKYQR